MAKQQTQASYQARLDRVVDHIYARLDDDIRPEGFAEIACLSPYHWHRIYVAMRGETIGATIRHLRLLRAADRLANSGLDIGMIAAHAGYSGADAFARAFRRPIARPRPTIGPLAAMPRSKPPRSPRTTRDFLSRSRRFPPRVVRVSRTKAPICRSITR
jgi:AraC-like DNA-binding protein